jgi:outer membrane protein OmpA-like peptidoglycan-associated protein
MKITTKYFVILAGLAGMVLGARTGAAAQAGAPVQPRVAVPAGAAAQAAPAAVQAPASSALPTGPASVSKVVSRTTKAGNYRRAGSNTKVSFHGTELLSQSAGEAKVANKGNRIEIEAQFTGLPDATKFGLEYLTYVMWSISPEGRAENLGEVILKNGAGEVKAITTMQTFGMVVTAEPYFAVTQPGSLVVMENVFGALNTGGVENIDAKYELLGPGAYSSTNTRIDNAIFGIDPKTPRELFEARNAVRIARVAQADKYAPTMLAKAEQQLLAAEDAYHRKADKKAVGSAARDVVETAEEARVMAVKQKAEADAQAAALAEKLAAEQREAKARADAADEMRRRQEAEQARIAAEQARMDAERIRHEAELNAQEASRQKAAAEQAAQQAALQQAAAEQAAQQAARQQAAAEQASQESARQRAQAEQAASDAARQTAVAQQAQASAIAQQHAAEAETAKARAAAAQAEAEKAALRQQLLGQLNAVLQTRDSARGLIVNMSDVLFDTGSYTLRPGAREKLAKVSGIVIAHPGLTLQIEGHTDSVGSDDLNQQLSEHRASSVREFLIGQGVQPTTTSARGYGKTQPVAGNETAEGRQRNRRVEIVVTGDAIGNGATSASAAIPAQ